MARKKKEVKEEIVIEIKSKDKIQGLTPDLIIVDEVESVIESTEDEAIVSDDITPVETTEVVFEDLDVKITEGDFTVLSTKQPFPKLKQVSEGGLTFYEIE